MECQAKLDAVNQLLAKAKEEGIAILGRMRGEQQKRLDTVESELSKIRGAIDVRLIKSIVEFAQMHGFRISWPTKKMGGAIHLQSMSLDGDALQEVANSVTRGPHRDHDADRFESLLAEQARLNMLNRSAPPTALETLIDQRMCK